MIIPLQYMVAFRQLYNWPQPRYLASNLPHADYFFSWPKNVYIQTLQDVLHSSTGNTGENMYTLTWNNGSFKFNLNIDLREIFELQKHRQKHQVN
jgi:hypothetical protein